MLESRKSVRFGEVLGQVLHGLRLLGDRMRQKSADKTDAHMLVHVGVFSPLVRWVQCVNFSLNFHFFAST